MRLTDGGAQSGGTAQHLLEQDTGLDPAHEYQSGNLRHINTSGQKVNRNHDFRQRLVFKPFDSLRDFLLIASCNTAGDFHNGIVIHTAFSIDFLQNLHDKVSVVVINSINQCFALAIWIEIPSDFIQNGTVKVLRDNLAIEAVNFKLHVIFQFSAVEDFAGDRIVDGKLFALFVLDTLHTKLGANIMRSIVIYQIAVNDSLTVRIVKNRLSEDFGSVQRRCCSQRNFHGIKVLNDGTVFADVVILVTVEHLGFAHFLIQNISTVCFVNHD